jgi:SAM-dependent methyltransferase
MSSPIAKGKKRFLDKVLIAFHKKVSHSNRVDLLSSIYVGILKSLNNDNYNLRLLDVGCGDMAIAKGLAAKYNKIKFICTDIYPNKENWENYVEFDGKNIPFNDREFDVALFSDVLHHDIDNSKQLLKEAIRVSKFIIIKDHFEYGWWSRRLLQFADLIGNYGYGVSVPKQYFNKKSFYKLLEDCNLKEIEHKCPVQLYERFSLIQLIFKSKYQFISIIQ